MNTSTPGPHDSDYGNRHDGVLFLKLALLLLVILAVGLLAMGVTIGTSQITVVAQGGSQTVCGSPFSPVKAGGAQPGGAILTQFGEWACQEKMGILGQISTVMAWLGACTLLAATAVAITLAVTVSQQSDRRRGASTVARVPTPTAQLLAFQGRSLRVVDVNGRRYVLRDDLVAVSRDKRIDFANHLNSGEWPNLRYSASLGSRATNAVFVDIAALPKLWHFFDPDQYAALAQSLTVAPTEVGDSRGPLVDGTM